MTDICAFGLADDISFTNYLVKDIGVAAVPGSSFYRDPRDGARHVRFAFCKKAGDFGRGGAKAEEAASDSIS